MNPKEEGEEELWDQEVLRTQEEYSLCTPLSRAHEGPTEAGVAVAESTWACASSSACVLVILLFGVTSDNGDCISLTLLPALGILFPPTGMPHPALM